MHEYLFLMENKIAEIAIYRNYGYSFIGALIFCDTIFKISVFHNIWVLRVYFSTNNYLCLLFYLIYIFHFAA